MQIKERARQPYQYPVIYLNILDYTRWVTQELCRHQQGTLPSEAMCLLIQHGSNVTNYIKRYLTCIECNQFPIETLHPQEVLPEPWTKIGVDFFQDQRGRKCLIVADYFSKFPYVFQVTTGSSFKTIDHLREIFAAEGVPAIVMSNNGPPFNSAEFQNFAHAFDFTHTTSSPHFNQSNGFIEAMVKKVKNAYRKTDGSPQWHKLYFSYETHPSQLIFLHQLKFFMDAQHKEPSLVDVPDQSTFDRSARNASRFRIDRRNSLTRLTEPRTYAFSRSRSK